MRIEEQDDQQFGQDQAANDGGNSAVGVEEGAGSAGANGEFVAEEERKSAVSRTTLMMFGVLAIGAGAVWFMYQRAGGPAAANAVATQESKKAQQTINNFLGNNGESIKSMESMLKNTEKVVQTFLNYPSMTQVPLSDLHTNPFRQKLSRAAAAGPTDDNNDRRRREEERLAMLKAVQGLQLQSVMCSETRRACMINNALYREGQEVDTFTVEKITGTSVVVKSGVYRFELKMQR